MNIKKILYVCLASFILGFLFIFTGAALGGLPYIRAANIDVFPGEIERNIAKDEIEEEYFYSEELEDISNVLLSLNSTNLEIKKAEDGKNRMEIFNYDKNYFSIEEQNGWIKVNEIYARREKSIIKVNGLKNAILDRGRADISSARFKLVLYLTDKQFDSISVTTDLGYVNIKDIAASEFNCDVDYGNLVLEDCNFTTLNVSNDAGEIRLSDIYVKSSADVDNDMGNARLSNLTVKNKLNVSNDMGNIVLDSCDVNKCELNASMGNVQFHDMIIGSKMDIINSIGNVTGSVVYDENKYYNVDATGSGNVDIDRQFRNSNRNSDDEVLININVDLGNIDLRAN